jgi:hypothetical protein
MRRIATLQTIRLMLVVSAAVAVSACAGGTQQTLPTANNATLTPQTGTRLTATLSSDRSASDENRNAEGGDDGNGTVVYSSIPKPLKAVASIGFEATQALEFGDGVNLTHTGKLQRVRYVLSSWGCVSGHWYSSDCVTPGTPTFPVPITVNVYAVDNTKTSRVGHLLVTQTKTFNIPYRPSSNHVRCPDGQTFYSQVDAACVHGLANVIVFDFNGPRANLPAQTIVSLSYNTSHYGPHPIGQSTPCYTSSGGCGYDSLNVSADGPGGPIGSPVDPNSVFDSFTQAADYCNPLLGTGFRVDTGCPPGPTGWTLNHPQFEIRVASGGGGDDEDQRGHHDE